MKLSITQLTLCAIVTACGLICCSANDPAVVGDNDDETFARPDAGLGEQADARAHNDGVSSGKTLPNRADAGPNLAEPELYAVMFEVFDESGASNSYLSLLDTLNIDKVDASTAREYAGGRAFLQTYNGWIFVGDPTSPKVTRYVVSDDHQLIEDGEIGFGNYGLMAGSLDDWNINFISEDKAYLFDGGQGLLIIWNPTTLEIVGEIEPPDELFREGSTLEGSPGLVRDNLLFRAFGWANYDTAEYSKDILLGVYDIEKDELIDLVSEERCGTLGNLVHQDELGTIYFSNWIWNIADALMREGPPTCTLRINPGETKFDEDWQLRFSEYTGGREGAMFSYVGDGQALFSVFHDENITFDSETDPWAYAGSQNWSVWSYDMDAQEAVRINGLDYNAGAFTPLRLGGRTFIMVPNSTWTSTQLYEVNGTEATPSVDIPGWSYQLKVVR